MKRKMVCFTVPAALKPVVGGVIFFKRKGNQMKTVIAIFLLCVSALDAKKPKTPKEPKPVDGDLIAVSAMQFDNVDINSVYSAMQVAAGVSITFVSPNTCLLNFSSTQRLYTPVDSLFVVSGSSNCVISEGHVLVGVMFSYNTGSRGGLISSIIGYYQTKRAVAAAINQYWVGIQQMLHNEGTVIQSVEVH